MLAAPAGAGHDLCVKEQRKKEEEEAMLASTKVRKQGHGGGKVQSIKVMKPITYTILCYTFSHICWEMNVWKSSNEINI